MVADKRNYLFYDVTIVDFMSGITIRWGDSIVVPGLFIDSVITVGAIGFVLTTRRFPKFVKFSLLIFISVTTGYAVANNLQALAALGISPLGLS